MTDPETGTSKLGHTLPVVYGVMLTNITRHYGSLPDPRSLSMSEIRFFYDGMRAELEAVTKPRN